MAVPAPSDLWSGEYKIPWHEPEFSRRMLAEHLTQDHDLASRRTETIAAQVEWIHRQACAGRPCRILDIACGPGLYSARLAALGHECRGIDFSPAAIAYAREQAVPGTEYVLGDIRTADFGTGHDLALMIYGEFNVFPPEDAVSILRRARAAVGPGGCLLLEAQTFASVRAAGLAPPVRHELPRGLFLEGPHGLAIESRWHEERATTQQQFTVTDRRSGKVAVYRNTTKAWTDDEIVGLLRDAGFPVAQSMPDWPVPGWELRLFLAR